MATGETTSRPAAPAPVIGTRNGQGRKNGQDKGGHLKKGKRAGQKKPRGLTVTRHYTTPGLDPFDLVEWDGRTATITGEHGEVVFEQKDVEMPAFWSQLATNVVVSKYFRGPLGTPQRERSVRQMIGRVTNTLTGWGRAQGYFATPEDADAFHAELTHILLNQKATFNSPVWFNVGVEEHPQCSACQPYHALVSTPEGMVPIGKLVEEGQIGREVYDANGTTSVIAVKANGRKPVYRVTLRNGSFIEATPDHLVKAVSERRTQPAWLRVDQLKEGMRLHLHPHRATVTEPALVAWGEFSFWETVPFSVVDRVEEIDNEQRVREAQAALAGWLQADGFVGQYKSGTNTSLTIEFQVANDEEYAWVTENLDLVFGEVHRHVREVETQDKTLRVRRIRLYGEGLREFVVEWELLARGTEIRVPSRLWTASRSEVAAYLRSVFQAEGYISTRRDSDRGYESSLIGMAVISERWTEDIQLLLNLLGIYSRRLHKKEHRRDRHDTYEVRISIGSERARFAEFVGFVSEEKQEKLRASLNLPRQKNCGDLREEEIVAIEFLGIQDVYDIQTESGEYLSNNVAVHNCFILSVEDTMESILDWCKTEGMIFKGGSGSGINLSKIRSSKESLSAGGQASGPISFMRAADSVAGSIKSGGKTRRAAKMVVLNIDHPDVADFIWCKAKEEKKAWALGEAGWDMSLNGEAWSSIQFQNANNSVRVTDEFMRAYEQGKDWSLRAITTGKVLETHTARDLMRWIAEAAWQCGDPGMQYDTTINDWHTCPNSGRINASNPCCVTGDTLIAVADGRNAVSIRELVGQEVPVYAWDHRAGKTVIAWMRNIGIKRRQVPVYRVTLDDGSSFRATDDHLIMLRDGSYRQVKDLKTEDSLNPFHSKISRPATVRTTRRYIYTGHSWRVQYRWIWEAMHGLKPVGFHIHHRDFDSLNDRPENLQLLPEEKHKALHREKMLGDQNPARRAMTDEWRAHIAAVVRGEKNPHYGKPHTPDTRTKMRAAAAQRWNDPQQHALSSERARRWMAAARAMGRRLGREPGERYERCCPVCRQNFITAREEQIFCSSTCRLSPLGMAMSGAKGGETRRGRTLSPEHREKLRLTSIAAARPEDKRRAAEASLRNRCLKAAKALMDAGHEVRLETWDEIRDTARALGVPHVPHRESFQRFFASDAELREHAALYNHKVVSVEFDGIEDVYDGTVDGHHNFAIITSETPSSMTKAGVDYSGCFIHNSEYMHLDSSSCNLSSINLLQYLNPDGTFDIESFQHTVDVMILAQDIIVDNSSYPTPKITENAKAFRELGLGYANLGALLMSLGLPYDSDQGRAVAGAITALMTGRAYRQSARIAERMGPFNGYALNREPMLRVIRKHRAAVDHINADLIEHPLLKAARAAWDEALRMGERHGYKNSQASVLAPTGTIAFMMDCDTTGVEPDIALVKYKRLVGGGVMKIVNRTVEAALVRLGYAPEEVATIIAHIDQTGTIEGAPGLKPEHLPVFDCAFRPENGIRSIPYMGHIRMMAAAQPFLSGAISKTVNLPNDATVEDVMQAYVEGGKLGLKALAIYRDGSKKTQPLSTKSSEKLAVETRPTRRRLPDERKAITHKFSISGHEGYITVGLFDDGTPGEIFLTMSKEGSTISGLMDAFATAVSLTFQYGVPLEVLVRKFSHMRFEPSGFTGNKQIPMAKSIMDYIFRWLALKFLPPDAQPATVPGLTNGEAAEAEHPAPIETGAVEAHERAVFVAQADAPPCPDCGSLMTRNGSCYRCLNCGSTSGCS